MSELVRRCTFTIDYHSRAFVEDALYFARWILRLKNTDASDREQMLAELGIGEGVSLDRREALVQGAGELEAMALRLRKGELDQHFRDKVASEIESKAFEMRILAEPTKEAPATVRKAVPEQ